MKFYLFLLLFLLESKTFSQKVSWGIIGGFTNSFEFTKQNKKNPFAPLSTKKTVYIGLKPTFGIYTKFECGGKQIFELQLRKLTIVKYANQDSIGRPILAYAKTSIQSLNTTINYGYNFNNKLSAYFGVYDNIYITHGIRYLDLPLLALSLKYYNNSFGGTIKFAYNLNRLSIESGFMYPFSPTAQSRSTLYYNPTGFIQLKYKLSLSKQFRQKIKNRL